MSTLNEKIYMASEGYKYKVWVLLVSRKMISAVMVSIALIFCFGSLVGSKVEANKITCLKYSSRLEAQKAFDEDKQTGKNSLSHLDGWDHDGKVCESTKYNKK